MTEIEKAIFEIKSGNFSGQEFIYNKFKNLLYKLGIDNKLCYEDAEDLMIETFTKLPKDIIKFEYRNDNAFINWVITIHLNNIRAHFRKKKIKFENIDDYKWEQLEFEDNEEHEDLKLKMIKEEIDKLTEEDRILINMRAKEIPYKSISDILKSNPGALKVKHLRITKKLESNIKEKFIELGLLSEKELL